MMPGRTDHNTPTVYDRHQTRSKYNVDLSSDGRRRRTYGGRVYASRAEAEYALSLDLQQRAGLIRAWQPQYRIPLIVNGVTVCTYVADFRVVDRDDVVSLHEVKGSETRIWLLKRKLLGVTFLRDHPGVELVVVRA